MRRARAGAAALAAAVWLGVAGPAQAAPPPPPVDRPVDAASVRTFPAGDLTLTSAAIRFAEATLDGSVVADGDEITLAADVFFDYNSARLTKKARAALGAVVERLRAAGVKGLRVTGHTDSRGTEAHNRTLSQRRARAVASALRSALEGIAVTAAGRGEREPRADNATGRGRALNRRVTIAVAR